MGPRDELEEALAARWDRETLAVYADHLQAIGDPRGELIAIDLQIEAGGGTAALADRRTSLLYGWLGALMPADNPHAAWIGDSIRFGFVDDLVVDSADRLAPILASPAAPYLRGVTICGATDVLERALEMLATRRHTWLERLSLRAASGGAPIAAETIDSLVAAVPRLAELDIEGARVVEAFPHPGVRRLRIAGWDAIASLFGGAPGLDGVISLDLRLRLPGPDDFADDAPDPQVATLFSFRLVRTLALPALQRLDLSRSKQAMWDNDQTAPFSYLRAVPRRELLTHLRLPAMRSDADFDLLAAAVQTMPALVEVELVGGSYFEPPDLPHPTARFVRPPPWPWPCADEVAPDDVLHVELGRYSEELVVYVAAYEMEQRFEGLAAEDRVAWTELWRVVRAGSEEIAAQVLLRAVEACPELLDGGWRDLRDELRARRPFADGAIATIRRG